MKHCPMPSSLKFHLPASNCFDTAQEKPKGTGFFLVGGTGREPILIQGGHILRDFHILREFLQFSLRFPGYFQIFPGATQERKSAAINFYLHLCHTSYIFPEFSRFFFKN